MINNPWEDWTIEEKIGSGGFATVYKAAKKVDGIKVYCAIKHIHFEKSQSTVNELIKDKIIKDENEASAYFEEVENNIFSECMTMSQFKNFPYIIECYDYKENIDSEKQIYDYYMKLELAKCVDDIPYSDFDQKEIIKLGMEVCQALIVCHKNNIIHRDIKTSNIFKGEDNFYKVGDFGSASFVMEPSEKIIGSYSYMAPEIYNKQAVTCQTDIYSLGIVLYKLLNKKLPFLDSDNATKEEKTKAFNLRMSGEPLPIIEGVDSNLMETILKACAYKPEDRYSTAKEFQEALNKVYNSTSEVKPKVSKNNAEKTISVYAAENIKMSDASLDLLKKELKKNKSDLIFKKKKKNGTVIINEAKKEDEPLKTRIKKKIIKFVKYLLLLLLLLLLIFFCYKRFFDKKDCSEGYVLNNGRCVEGNYVCQEGYTLNDDNKCSMISDSTEAIPSYTCPEDYVQNANACIKTDAIEPTVTNYCSVQDFSLQNGKCVKTIVTDAITYYSCPSKSYTLNGSSCISSSNSVAATFTCPSGYTKSGTTCSKTISDKSLVKTTTKTAGTCDNGTWTLNKDDCANGATKASGFTIGATSGCTTSQVVYGLSGTCYICGTGVSTTYNKCTTNSSSTTTTSCSDSSYTYANGTCSKTVTTAGSYTCSSGYTLVGSKCYSNAVAAEKSYKCVEGSLKGSKCYTSITMDATPTYTCPDNYTFTGSMCVYSDEKAADVSYSCLSNYTLNGARCEKYKVVDPDVELKK